MNTRHAKITLNPTAGRTAGTVEIDGQPIPGVAGIQLSGGVHGLPHLSLNLVVHEVEVEGEMVIEVRPKTRAALLALGWTPPAEEVPDGD